MKTLLLVLSLFLVLNSCVKYAEPDSLSLGGEYRIDKITYESVGNDPVNMVFYPGQLYVNTSETAPLDTIEVGFTRIAFDYSSIYMNPVDHIDGSTSWGDEYYYFVHGQYSAYELGYIQFDYNGTRRTWKIIDDGLESLVLRTSGSYDFGNAGPMETTTMFLTRIGP
jgi:hypothetical protein